MVLTKYDEQVIEDRKEVFYGHCGCTLCADLALWAPPAEASSI
jgi:hypothetical protein